VQEDSSLIAFRWRRITGACWWLRPLSARHGTLKTLDDLLQHNCLRFMVEDVIHDRWQFGQGSELQELHVQGNRSADDADVVRRWAVAGLGIAYKSRLDLATISAPAACRCCC
jgi:DNA-binding transcriptional LysR family regulator